MFLSLGCIFEGLCCSYTAGLVRVCVAKTPTQLSLKNPLILPMGSHVQPVVGKANAHKYTVWNTSLRRRPRTPARTSLRPSCHQQNIVITTISTVTDTLVAAFKDFCLTPTYRVERQVTGLLLTRFRKVESFFTFLSQNQGQCVRSAAFRRITTLVRSVFFLSTSFCLNGKQVIRESRLHFMFSRGCQEKKQALLTTCL